jgi:hypothetical protein
MFEAFNNIVNTIITKQMMYTEREEIRKLIPYLEISFTETPDIDLELYKNKYVELYHFYIELYKKNILPNYLSAKLRTDNLEYSSYIDIYVKSHWVSNQIRMFENTQYYYDETIHIIKKLFEIINVINNEENSLRKFVPEKIVPNTIAKIVQSDRDMQQAAQRGEVRLYYGTIHFNSDRILENSESRAFVFRM